MPASYSAPAFRIEVDASGLEAEVSKNILQLRVVQELDSLDSFSLTLANPYPEMPWTHDEEASELFREGSSVRIEMGYVDDLATLLTGEITSITPSFPETGTPTVGVQGHSRLHRLNAGRKHRTFLDMSDREIAEQIATEAQLTPEVEDTGPRHPYVLQDNRTDLEFLLRRARLIRFELRVDDRTLIFRRAREDESTALTLVWAPVREDLSAADEVLPLQSFEPTLNTLRQVSEVQVLGYDPGTKQAIVGRAASGDEQAAQGDRTGPEVAAEAFGARTEVLSGTPVASQEEADQLAGAVYNRLASRFLTGTGATPGAPGLRPGRTVELRGLGRFSGSYYVTRATHSIGGAGYRTRFVVRRNAI